MVNLFQHKAWQHQRQGQQQQQQQTTAVVRKPRVLSITVDDAFVLYIDGVEQPNLPNHGNWGATDTIEIPDDTEVIAIRAYNTIGIAGILASTSDEYVLTNSTWKCTNNGHDDWMSVFYNDESWQNAISHASNGQGPWGPRPGISPKSKWIWTPSHTQKGLTIYCRLRLPSS